MLIPALALLHFLYYIYSSHIFNFFSIHFVVCLQLIYANTKNHKMDSIIVLMNFIPVSCVH